MKETGMNWDNPADIMDLVCFIKFMFMNVMIADTNIILLKQVLFILEINRKTKNKLVDETTQTKDEKNTITNNVFT